MPGCAAPIILAVTAISLWTNTPFPVEAAAIDRVLQSDYTEVEGNHLQFGHYNEAQNQRPQKVTRKQQQASIVKATLQFIGL